MPTLREKHATETIVAKGGKAHVKAGPGWVPTFSI